MIEQCPWYVAGPILGLLIVGLRAALNRPFGALGGYVDLAENAAAPGRLGFRAVLLLGIVLGGLAFASTLGSFTPSIALSATAFAGPPVVQLGLAVAAGVAMGIGARTAGGCTSGHGMTGMSLGSPASIVACMTFFATAVGLAHLFVRVGGTP